jgi:hypothetical protein
MADLRSVLQAALMGRGGAGVFGNPGMTRVAASDPDLSGLAAAVAQKWPRLDPHLKGAKIQWGPAQADDRQLEFYPPWEQDNPNPGQTTLELYNRKLTGPALESAVAGDMLHLLGTTDPATGKPVDQRFFDLKQQLNAQLTAQHRNMDFDAYKRELPLYGDNPPSFSQWMQQSRLDAYIRGYLTPDEADNWRKAGAFTPAMTKTLEEMRSHLESAD